MLRHFFKTTIDNRVGVNMSRVFTHFGGDGESRREELIRTIEHSVEKLTLGELEALYYDLVAKDYIRK